MASIEKRTTSKGKTRYRVKWREGGTRDGEPQSATFNRQQEARDFAARVAACGHHWPDDTTGAASVPPTATVDQLATAYLADRARRVRSDRTIADYHRDYARWIAPFLGSTVAATLTDDDVQEWVDAMADGTLSPTLKPAAPKSVRDRHALLSGALAWGIRKGRLGRNPCQETQLPKRQKGAPKGLRPAEWDALYAALVQIDPDAADLALFLLASGWRWSEATALTTFDVEDYGEGGPLHVTLAQVTRRNAAGQRVIVEEGKGQASIRRIQLDDAAAAMVRRRMVGLRPGALVFTTGRYANGLGGSQWHESNFRRRYWDKAVEVANLARRPTPHWLRHTHVVWMHNTGSASLAELQARIGHASITTTIGTYGRMLTDVKPATLSAFAAMRGRGAISPAGHEPRQISTER